MKQTEITGAEGRSAEQVMWQRSAGQVGGANMLLPVMVLPPVWCLLQSSGHARTS